MKRWHTNKTQPLGLEGEDIIVIWNKITDNIQNNYRVEIYTPNVNEFNQLYLIDCGLWKDVKKDIKCWAYVDKYFERELK